MVETKILLFKTIAIITFFGGLSLLGLKLSSTLDKVKGLDNSYIEQASQIEKLNEENRLLKSSSYQNDSLLLDIEDYVETTGRLVNTLSLKSSRIITLGMELDSLREEINSLINSQNSNEQQLLGLESELREKIKEFDIIKEDLNTANNTITKLEKDIADLNSQNRTQKPTILKVNSSIFCNNHERNEKSIYRIGQELEDNIRNNFSNILLHKTEKELDKYFKKNTIKGQSQGLRLVLKGNLKKAMHCYEISRDICGRDTNEEISSIKNDFFLLLKD